MGILILKVPIKPNVDCLCRLLKMKIDTSLINSADPDHDLGSQCLHFILFVCFFALGPKSTAMVMAGRSVHLATFFPRQA